MIQTFLLMVLALGMCSINTSAQSKVYKLGNDGFEWYEIKNSDGKYGVNDKYGNLIIPVVYDQILYYEVSDPIDAGFQVFKDKYSGWYNKSGKCMIPYTRQYTHVQKNTDKNWGTYYWVKKNNGMGICDKNGIELVFVQLQGIGSIIPQKMQRGKQSLYYYSIGIDYNRYYGIADALGNVVVEPKYEKPNHIPNNLIFSRVKTTKNPFVNNKCETINESEGNPEKHSNSDSTSSSSTTSSSSSSRSSNNNSGNNTTTVVVEHHRDPVPVQEWVQCTSCWGSGNCRNCAGSGTTYIGSNLHRCSMCGGRGRCTTCSGQGGRNQTVYR